MDYIKRIKDLREDNDKTQQEIADVLKNVANNVRTIRTRGKRTACSSPDYAGGLLQSFNGLYFMPNE